MHVQAIPFSAPLFIGSAVAIVLVLLVWLRRNEPGALAFIIGMLALTVWSATYAVELLVVDINAKILCHKIEYTAIPLVPAFWLLFLLQHDKHPPRWMKIVITLLLIEPLLFIVATWTNDYHHLLWQQITLSGGSELPHLVIERGLGFYIHTAYNYLIILAATWQFMSLLLRSSLKRTHVILLTTTFCMPLLINFISLAGINPLKPLDLTPFALVSMGLGAGWFAFRFQFWDMLPAARNEIVESMNDGVIILDRHHVVIDLNRAAQRLLILNQDDVVGHPLAIALERWKTPDDIYRLLDEDSPNNPTSATPSRVSTMQVARQDNTQSHIDLLVSNLYTHDRQIAGHVLTLRDVTPRALAEQALAEERATLAQRVAERTADLSEANAQLARAARLKDEFLANMSHELRTPLNTVLGMTEVLQDQIYGPVNERQQRSLRSIDESGRHLLALINDVLDVSKIEAGKLTLELRSVNAETVGRSSIQLVRQSAHKKDISIDYSVDPLIKVVNADERRLKQMLVNLLSNAVKFTPEHGKIGLEVQGDAQNEVVHFTVWDTGIGISEENMSRLFQPFVQLDSKLTREHEGSGLGLALVYRMAELHGGSVKLESQVGKGSRFTISLPWHKAVTSLASTRSLTDEDIFPRSRSEMPTHNLGWLLPRTNGETKPSRVPAPHKIEAYHILLVEDNETNITTFYDYLAAKGYQVQVARNGSEAMQRLHEERPSLMLLDIQMPGMDGIEVTRQVRADVTLRYLPIIALTALAMPCDRERCLDAGVNDYISKPVSLKQLASAIEIQLQREKVLA